LSSSRHGDVLTRRERRRRRAEPQELRRAEPRRLPKRLLEALAADGLQQIADGLRVERLERVLVVRSREHDRRRVLERAQMSRDLDARHARHADVEQHDGRFHLGDLRERIGAVRADVGDAATRQLLDEPLQALARRLLVVDDQDAQGANAHSV
jgi:hypothetical protein